MSYSYYWWCGDCYPEEPLRAELLAGETSAKDQALPLKNSGYLTEAFPYYDVEVLSNRPEANRRCRKCDCWHSGGMYGSGYPKPDCDQHTPRHAPTCTNESHVGKMQLLFVEKDALVIVRRTFSSERPFWVGRDYVGRVGAYDAYLYQGSRYERGDVDWREVVSAVYFGGPRGKRYGTYSPYFGVDDFFRVVETMTKSI